MLKEREYSVEIVSVHAGHGHDEGAEVARSPDEQGTLVGCCCCCCAVTASDAHASPTVA